MSPKGLDSGLGESENIPASIQALHTDLTTFLESVRQNVGQELSKENITDEDARAAMMYEIRNAQDDSAFGRARSQTISPRDWKTPELRDMWDWKSLVSDVDVDSDYDKKYFRAIMDAHDKKNADVGYIHAMYELQKAFWYLNRKKSPLDEYLSRKGDPNAINDPEVRANVEAITRVSKLYGTWQESIERKMQEYQASIENLFLREEEKFRLEMLY